MRTRKLPDLDTLPMVVEPSSAKEAALDALLDWAVKERRSLDDMLLASGAVLFRGFGLAGAADLARASRQLGGELQSYVGGDSPRSQVADKVYNSTEFPPHLPIGLHNELSYAGWWPSRIFFHCQIAPKVGGQTQLGDSRTIYARMPGRLRERFERHGVRYIQNLHKGKGPGKSWQQTFETEDPEVVEAYCAKHGMAFRWTAYGLNTSILRHGVIKHPTTGTMSWFNQAEHWHGAVQSVRFWDAGEAKLDPDKLPAHCTLGDGSELTRADLETIAEVTAGAEVLFDWQQGDLLMLDNLLTAHGRKPFEGERKILVAMA